jgi:hypothetical protein
MFLPLTSALLAMAFSRQSWVRSGRVRSGQVPVFTFDFCVFGDGVLEAVVGQVGSGPGFTFDFCVIGNGVLETVVGKVRLGWVGSGLCFYL